MSSNTDYFNVAITGEDPKNKYGYERNLTQFMLRMAALKYTVEFGFRGWNGGKILVASTPLGNYEFLFDQNDNLVIDQVL